jgi:signal transduction histidine kinase
VADQGLGLGLQAIRKRVDATGGVLSLETAPHRGTRLNASWKVGADAPTAAAA